MDIHHRGGGEEGVRGILREGRREGTIISNVLSNYTVDNNGSNFDDKWVKGVRGILREGRRGGGEEGRRGLEED